MTVLALAPALTANLAAQTDADGSSEGAAMYPAVMPRFVLAPPVTEDPGIRVVADAIVSALTTDDDALWFVLDPVEPDASTDDIAALAWDVYQGEVLVALSVRPGDGASSPVTRRDTVRVTAEIIEVRPRDGAAPRTLTVWDGQVTIDAAGRYLRRATWEDLERAVAAHRETARPTVVVTLRSNGPVTLHGLPDWVDVEPIDGGGARLTVRSLREYVFTVARPGHRSRERTVYVERQPVEVAADLTPYPRHTVAFSLRELSWPVLQYGWYPASTAWTVRAEVTSFLVGLTPFRQLLSSARTPRVVSSYPLTEFSVGWHWITGNRDRLLRGTLGIAAAVRFVHGVVPFGLDPVVPWAARPTAGLEWELSDRLILTQQVSSDLFLSPRPAFLPPDSGVLRAGPVFVQVPLYRAGVRLRL